MRKEGTGLRRDLKRLVLVANVVCLAWAVSGCGSNQETPPPAPANVPVGEAAPQQAPGSQMQTAPTN
jgi:hypothetical protein